jgi:hypothetical protein
MRNNHPSQSLLGENTQPTVKVSILQWNRSQEVCQMSVKYNCVCVCVCHIHIYGTRDWTLGFALGRQVLSLLSHAPSLMYNSSLQELSLQHSLHYETERRKEGNNMQTVSQTDLTTKTFSSYLVLFPVWSHVFAWAGLNCNLHISTSITAGTCHHTELTTFCLSWSLIMTL